MKNILLLFFTILVCKYTTGQNNSVPASGTNSICVSSGTIYDHGYTSYYSNNANGILTIYPSVSGSNICLRFSEISIDAGGDFLKIYDGTSTLSPLIQTLNGTPTLINISATNSSGALTLEFKSDASYTSSGFKAAVSCITSSPYADLVLKSGSIANYRIPSGSNSNINFSIDNQSATPVSSYNTAFYLSLDNKLDTNDLFLNDTTSINLNGNSAKTLNSPITIPSETTNGNYYVILKTDYTNSITEANESNNIFEIPITIVTPLPDFMISAPYLSVSSAIAGVNITAYGNIYNYGNVNSDTTNLGFYLSSDLKIDTSDIFLASSTISVIPTGTYLGFTKSLTIPSTLLSGQYYIIYNADNFKSTIEVDEENNTNANCIAVLDALTDLSVIKTSTSASNVITGSSVTLSYTISNQSFQSVSPKVSFYLSSDSILDITDTYLSNATLTIAAHAQNYSSISLSLGATAGNFYILTTVDYLNTIVETDETNNTFKTSIIVTNPFYDLRVETTSISKSTIAFGTSITTNCVIQNMGNLNCSSNIFTVYLSTDTLLNPEDISLYNYSLGTLYVNSGANLSPNITIPSNTLVGNYYLLFIADYTNIITESNELNNIRYQAISVISPIVDILIQSPVIAKTSFPVSNAISVSCSILNNGNTSISYSNVGYYLSTDTLFDTGDLILANSTGGTINSGTLNTKTASITIPSNTILGNYYILFFADYLNQVSETDETNNLEYIAITVVDSYSDLIITNATCPSTSFSGYTISVTSNMNNTGTISTSSSNVGYYLSTDTLFDANDTYLFSQADNALTAGSSKTNVASLTIPNSIVDGNYYILYYADYSNQVAESNETNNISFSPITINGALNIVPSSGSNSITACSGVITDYAGLSSYNSASNGILTINPGTVGSKLKLSLLSFNTYYNTTLSIYDGPSTASPLLKSFSGVSSPEDVYATSSSGALTLRFINTATYTYSGFQANISCVSSKPLADLTFKQGYSISSSTVPQGESLTASCTLYNLGGFAAPYKSIGYYLSTDTIFDISDVTLTEYNPGQYAYLNAGSLEYNSTSIIISRNMLPGNYYILFCADYLNQVVENDENNNIKWLPISIISKITDVELNTPSLSTNPVMSGSTTYANSKVKNLGNTTLQNSKFKLAFYLSNDTILDSTDIFLNNIFGATLAPNATASLSSLVTIPSSTPTGNYYIIYLADCLDSLDETDELNNLTNAPISIIAPNVDLKTVNCYLSANNAAKGATLTANSYIFNQGSSSSPSSNIGYYLSQDSIWDINDLSLLEVTGSSLTAGNLNSRSSLLSMPSNAIPGSYFIIYYTDYNNQIIETNENNNFVALRIDIVDTIVDLTTNKPTLSKTDVIAGTATTISIAVHNIGNITSSSSNIGFYLSNDSIFDNSDALLSSIAGSSLSANSLSQKSTTLTIPANTQVGSYYILSFIDNGSIINEANENNNISYSKINVLPIKKDVFIKYPYFTENISSPGASIVAYSFLLNQSEVSINTNIDYFLSTDSIWDTSDMLIESSTLNSISAYSSVFTITSLDIPSTTSIADYYILFYVDNSNLISETNETNNVCFVPISIVNEHLDLTASDPIIFSANSIIPDTPYASNFTIKNIGTTSASFFDIGYYLSVDDSLDASDLLVSTIISSVSDGIPLSKSADISFPFNTAPGNYKLLIKVDYNDQYAESIESNNITSTPVKIIAPSIDLAFFGTGSLSTSTVSAGGSLDAYYGIINNGNYKAKISSSGFYLSTNTTLESSDIFLGFQTGGEIKAGYSANYNSTINIPFLTTPGTYYILFYINYLNAENEMNEGNNLVYKSITINATNIDLTTNSPTAPSSMNLGNNITVSCNIYNQGVANSISSNVGYYLSTDNTWDASDIFLSYNSGSDLAAGASSVRSSVITIPYSTVPGNYYILCYADYQNYMPETNEDNNISYTPITVNPSNIELKITSPNCPTLAYLGASVSISCTIQNIGTVSSSTSNIGYYISTDTIWNSTDIFLQSSTGATLNAYSSSSKILNITIPSLLSQGNYYILFYADYTGLVVEANETNNVAYKPIKIESYRIDLVPNQPNTAAQTVNSGGTLMEGCFVSNTGTVASTSCNVGYYLSKDDIFDIGDVFLTSKSGGALSSGTSVYNSTSITIPDTTSSGIYYVLLFADYLNTEIESDENNNVTYKQITVTRAFDLLISSKQTQSLIIAGDSLFSSCNIRNTNISRSSISNLGLYLSTDSVWDISDMLLATSDMADIAGNSFLSININSIIPSNTIPGNYYLLFYADPNNLLSELNETNNIANLKININNNIDTLYAVPFTGIDTITTCNGFISDHGKTFGYSNSANGVLTIYPETIGAMVKLSFSAFSTELDYDTLTIYNGESINAPIIGKYHGTSVPHNISATNIKGAITLKFTSDRDINNKGFLASISCIAVPDIQLISAQGPTFSYQNGFASVYSKVLNQSSELCSANEMRYFISTDTIYDNSDVFVGSSTIGILTPLDSIEITSNLLIPNSINPGNYHLLFCADYYNEIYENTESNNIRNISIEIRAIAVDLIVNNTIVPAYVLKGIPFSVDCDIKNIGHSTSSSSNLGYYLSTDNIWNISDILLSNSISSSINPTDSTHINAQININNSILSGNYYLIFYVDYNNLNTEINEANNYYSIPILVDTNTSVVENIKNLDLKIFPSPTSDFVYLKYNNIGLCESLKIELINISGQIFFEKEITNNTSSDLDLSFDVRNLSPGIYFIRTISEKFVINSKIIIN